MSTELGHTQFTRSPDRPNSTAIAFVSMTTPPFDAVYAALYGNARRPETDAMFTIAPPASSSGSSAAWLIKKVPVRLTASVRFHSSSASSRVDANDPTPAMFART